MAAPSSLHVKIDGMTCPACPLTVKKVLSRVGGVEKAEVSFEKREATVTFEDGGPVVALDDIHVL